MVINIPPKDLVELKTKSHLGHSIPPSGCSSHPLVTAFCDVGENKPEAGEEDDLDVDLSDCESLDNKDSTDISSSNFIEFKLSDCDCDL